MKTPLLYGCICIQLILLLARQAAYASDSLRVIQERRYQDMEVAWKNNTITELEFVKSIDSLTEQLTVSGLEYSGEQLTALLGTFKELVWEQENYRSYKANYFRFLMNNAFSAGRSGEALFYAEKNEKALSAIGRKTFLTPYTTLLIWAKSGNNEQVLSLYQKQRPYLAHVLDQKLGSSGIIEGLQILQFYFYTMKPLLELNSPLAEEVKENAKQLSGKLIEMLPETALKIDTAIPRLLSLFTGIEFYAHKNNALAEKRLLDSVLFLLQKKEINLRNYKTVYENIAHSMALNYHLKMGHNDQSEYYLEKMIGSVKVFDDEHSNLYHYRARLSYNKGDLKQAFQLLDSALTFKGAELTTAYSEMMHLLYAHTESEYNRNELTITEKIRRGQQVWVIGVSLLAITISIAAYFVLKKVKRKAKQQIAALNEMTDIAIEEAGSFATKEEQKRLGQDLHDDLSGSLLSALHQLELTKNRAKETDVLEQLEALESRVQSIYHTVRLKSHRVYQLATENASSHFEKSVINILEAAFEQDNYAVQVELDQDICVALSLRQRIELLRILQEATANILKHSKASEVSVFLYKEEQGFVFQVSDNGIGFNETKVKKGLGLNSIQNRVRDIKGRLEIIQEEGATLLIYFVREGHS